MNLVVLTGNLCDNPQAFTTQSGVSRSSFRLAVRRPFKRDETDFLPVIAWRATADFCNKYLTKGSKVSVEGSIQTRSYDAQDGSKRYVTEIVAERIESLSRAAGEAQEANAPAQESPAQNDGFQEVDEDDELPFDRRVMPPGQKALRNGKKGLGGGVNVAGTGNGHS